MKLALIALLALVACTTPTEPPAHDWTGGLYPLLVDGPRGTVVEAWTAREISADPWRIEVTTPDGTYTATPTQSGGLWRIDIGGTVVHVARGSTVWSGSASRSMGEVARVYAVRMERQ